MESVAFDALEVIVELAVEEVMQCILATKCCAWSRKKWKKVMDQVKQLRSDRKDRIAKKLSVSNVKQDILEYAVKITNI